VTAAEPTSASQAFRRFVVAGLFIGLMLVAYFGFFAFVGYTDDAYIKSDLIRVAPGAASTALWSSAWSGMHLCPGSYA
jgi:multidrug resistance efflux pump